MYLQHRREAKESQQKKNGDAEKGQNNEEKNQNGVAVPPEQSQINSILGSQLLGIENAAFEMEKYKL